MINLFYVSHERGCTSYFGGKSELAILMLAVFAAEPSEKSVEIMRKFSEQYARRSGTYFCVDKGVTSVVIKVYKL